MVDVTPTILERLATLEAQQKATNTRQQEILDKLDELLGLRNKGVGAFWVISAITGTGLIGLLLSILEWLKGAGHG
jgi:hypothetical protein